MAFIPKRNKKKKDASSTTNSKVQKITFKKSNTQLLILTLLILLIPLGIYTNFFAFEFRYFQCRDWPLELRGSYYRLPSDEGYGIHSDSDYSYCQFEYPRNSIRDPSTTMGAKIAAKKAETEQKMRDFSPSVLGFTLYTPKNYKVSKLPDTHALNMQNSEVRYAITTNGGFDFDARVMSKNSNMSYTNLCSRPSSENWSGVVIGKDSAGRDICRAQLSKYIKKYIVGVNIGNTGIMLQAPLGKISEKSLDAEVTRIFSSMEAYPSEE